MSRPIPKLSPQDAATVDLVLNHDRAGADGAVSHLTATPSQAHLKSATKLLKLLDHLSAQDPPHGLVERTLHFIERADGRAVGQQVHITEPVVAGLH